MKRLLLILTLACSTAFAATPDVVVPLDPAVRTGKLPNGFTYYIRKNAKPEKRVELRLVVNAGSVQEDDDQRGLAHFVEHMGFNGTAHFPKNELINYLQSAGVKFGAELNAFTSFDETMYLLPLPSDKPELLEKGILILCDWASQVTFNPADIDKERKVIVEEWRLKRGPAQRILDQQLPVLLKDSKYAQHLPIGTKESIEGSTHDAIKRFYRDWYRPDNMALIVVGDIDPANILDLVEKSFGAIPAAQNPRVKSVVPVPDHEQPLYSIVSDRENPNNNIRFYFKTDIRDYSTVAGFRQDFSEGLVTQMLNYRLWEIAQQPAPPFLGASASFGMLWVRTKAGFYLSVSVAENGFERGTTTALTEIERVQRFGFTAAELDRAKQRYLKAIENAYQERDKRPSSALVDNFVNHFLEGRAAPDIAYTYTFAKEHFGSITLDEVNGLIKKWITPKNRVTLVQSVEKEGVKLPTEAELQAIGQAVATAKIEPYQEKELPTVLMGKTPAPGRIVEEKHIAEIDVTELTFANGIRVVLKPTTFKNDEISFSAYRRGGQSLFPDDYNLSAQLADSYIVMAGLADFPMVDLAKMLAGKKASVRASIQLYSDQLSGGCVVNDRETLFQLMHLTFTQQRRDENAYKSMIAHKQSFYQNQLKNPQVSFSNDVQKARYNNHPRIPGLIPTDADWATVTLDKVIEVGRSRFKDAGGFTFIFVGSFTVESLKPLLATYLGSLPGKPTETAWKDLGLRSIRGPVNQSFYRGMDPKCLSLISLERPATWSRNEAHLVWSLGNILTRSLRDKLRVEMAGVYGVDFSSQLSQTPYQYSSFSLTLPCAPENVQPLTEAAYAEIKRFQTSGPTPEELQKEIETQRRSAEKDAKENGAWQWKLVQIYRDEGENFTRLSNPEELISIVTAPEIQRVAQQYLNTEECLRYTLYPEKK